MNCQHKETKVIETPNLVHFGKEVCADCGMFIKWVSNPNKEHNYKEECAFLLDEALKKMSDNRFVQSCSEYFVNHKALSNKQVEVLKRILGVKQ